MVNFVRLKKDSFHSGKIAVKFSKLYGDRRLNYFEGLSFDELLKFLEENDFKNAVDTSYLQTNGFYLIERILNLHLSRVYKEIFLTANKSNRKLLESYYLKYQIHNLMVMIRCKIMNDLELEPFLIGDEKKKEKFIKAFKMPNIEDSIIYIIKKFGFNVKETLLSYSKGLYFLENYLYKEYYFRLFRSKFHFNNIDEKIFFNFIRKYVDLLNARTFLRLKIENIDIDFEDVYIQSGNFDIGFFLRKKELSVKELLKVFNKEFGDIEDCEDNSCVANLDRRINMHKRESNKVLKFISFSSPYYPLKYLFELEQETAKLRVILKTKYLEINRKNVEELV